MKKSAIIVFMITLLALLAVNAAALQVSSATIGGTNQDRVANVSTSFRVTNDGANNLTGITVSTNADVKYNLVLSPTTFNLNAGAFQTVTVRGDIPLDHSAVDMDSSSADYLEEEALKIADITAIGGGITALADLNMQADNKIKIKSATLYCGDSSDKLSDNDKVDDLKPDTDNCYLDITVENQFRENDIKDQRIGDVEFDTIDVEIEIDNDDFSVYESSTIDGLQADETDEADTDDLEFDIDEDVKDRTYTMELRVFGYDENNAFHGVFWEIKLDVVRESYDIQIKSPQMTPSKMDCDGGNLKIDANIINLGKKDDDEVSVEIDIADLDINVKRTGIDLDADDSTSVTFTVKVPKDVEEGIYPVHLNTYFKNTAISNTHVFELAIEACEAPEVTEPVEVITPTDIPTTVVTIPTDSTEATPAAPRARVSTSDDSEFRQSNIYLWLMGILVVLFAAVVVVLLVVFFIRKPK